MIYQYVKRYLKQTFKQPQIDFSWSLLDNVQFFNYIERRYTEQEFSQEISEVKEAFKDFFEPVGNIIFRYKEDSGVKFKIFPYRVEPKDSIHLKKILSIIQHNKESIKYPYKGQTDQIAILGKIRRDINKETVNTKESINIRELIKYAIRVALELGKRDVVIQLKRKYIVKIFDKNRALEAEAEINNPMKKKDAQSRFNGYTAEQIEETYKDIFEKRQADIRVFLNTVMKNIFREDLNFRFISNKFYEENALKIVHTAITKELTNYSYLENDYILGLTGYLMRKHFHKIHELMSVELISCIYEKNNNANDFLLFYNGKIVLIDNKKYKIPSLETEDGKQWNNSSLIGICNLWMKEKSKKKQYELKLIEADSKIVKYKEVLLQSEPERIEQEKTLKNSKLEIEKVNQKHLELESRLKHLESTNLNSTEYFSVLEKVKVSQQNITELTNKINDVMDKMKKNTNTLIYDKLDFYTNQKKTLLGDIVAQDLNINSKKPQIDPILNSIVNVLVARTKPL